MGLAIAIYLVAGILVALFIGRAMGRIGRAEEAVTQSNRKLMKTNLDLKGILRRR